MDETNMNAPQHSGVGRVIARHKAKLAACAAMIAVLGAGAVFAAEKPAPSSLLTPVADVSTSNAPQQAVPSFANLVERVKPAVVSVFVKAEEVDQVADSGQSGQGQNPFEGTPFQGLPFQFGPQSQDSGKPHLMQAQGSGFFISADGYLITNNHVVDHAKSVEIMTTDGKRYKAKVAGTDPKTDLALLKVDSSGDFPYVRLATQSPRIGDWVVAMGNPFGLGGTVTAGIVSANGRDIGSGPYDDFIQIDAPINKGNSGGPTFNQNGEVVGVNTAIFSPSGGSVGIAFDIPAETVKYVAEQLRSSGHVTRGWIGVSIQPVTADIADSLGLKEAKGALVDEPQDGGPAARAGLKSQDVIVSVNDHEIKDGRDLARTIAAVSPGSEIKIAYIRNGEKHSVDLHVGKYPDGKTAQNDQGSESDFKLGMTLAPADQVDGAGTHGAVVMNVDPEGKAAEKGIQQGDVILSVGGKSVSGPADVKEALRAARNANKRAVLMQLKTAQGDRFVAVPTTSQG
ncbi:MULTISPECIES: Do family serine endopeptidase [unclassified Hyphomicrobium]|uniref:Do family serine endopeptidase n=1 Tax=unclassified Hyphomicrobium TaxID=2619925 RepID=UPI000213DCF0|nr:MULTISPECIES: Do family serine endopeptidase [unclassified Hyphomicrobium]CCB64505.1 periplasmic serine protease (DegP) [Hyphomicrobium sp. MC1]